MPYAWGLRPFGQGRWGGDIGEIIVPPNAGEGFPYIVANDRYQLLVLSESGEHGPVPELRYWYGAAPDWSEVLGALRRDYLVPFYATDAAAHDVVGVLELPLLDIERGMEATIAGVLVECELRPYAVGEFDGNISPTTPVGFSVYVEGSRSPSIDAQVNDRQVGTVRSDEFDFLLTTEEVDDEYAPNRFGVWCPCRIDQHVRQVRVGFSVVVHARILSAEVFGIMHPSRYG